jgi:hypothetical protein
MNSRNLLTHRKESSYKMDPSSDRYRVCPNDGFEFMAFHRSEKFCCPQCADEFHNEKRRLAAQQLIQNKTSVLTAVPTEIPEQPPENNTESKETQQVLISLITSTSPLVGNINLIGATLGDKHSRKVHMTYLTKLGFVYDVYDNKHLVPGTELNVLTYGPYAVAWAYENHIIITYKKNIPWIQ